MASSIRSTPLDGADGTAHAWRQDGEAHPAVVALDEWGQIRAGWPFSLPAYTFGEILTPLADGSVLVGASDEQPRRDVHRLDQSGREMTGWPVRVNDASYCEAVPGGDGRVFLACRNADGLHLTLIQLDTVGRSIAGWPVTLEGVERLDASWGPAVQQDDDGTVYALGHPPDPADPSSLWAFAPGGSRRPGFPIALPSGPAGFRVIPGGRLLVGRYVLPAVPYGELCMQADRTILTELDASGHSLAGWPVTAKGWASPPVAAPNGTVYYLTDEGLLLPAPRTEVSRRAGLSASRRQCRRVGDKARTLGPAGRSTF